MRMGVQQSCQVKVNGTAYTVSEYASFVVGEVRLDVAATGNKVL